MSASEQELKLILSIILNTNISSLDFTRWLLPVLGVNKISSSINNSYLRYMLVTLGCSPSLSILCVSSLEKH